MSQTYQEESVIGALNLNGQIMMGQPIKVQRSQAEKNRTAAAAKVAVLRGDVDAVEFA